MTMVGSMNNHKMSMIHYVRKYVNQHFGSTIKMKIKANPNATNSEMDSKTIIKSNKSTKLNDLQRYDLITQFVQLVVDGWDVSDLEQFATEQLTDWYSDFSSNELKERIDAHDEGLYDELVDNVTNETVLDVNNTGGKY